MAIDIDPARLEAFCRRWQVATLEVFGSALRDDFGPDSDLDFLVTFKQGAVPGLGFVHMEKELAALVGRDVDLVTRRSIERSQNWIRRNNILSTARPIYIARSR